MKAAPGRDIWLCGGGTLASLLSDNLIDEIELTVYPLLLGSGIPVFSAVERQTGLDLTATRTHPSGLVALSYRVKS